MQKYFWIPLYQIRISYHIPALEVPFIDFIVPDLSSIFSGLQSGHVFANFVVQQPMVQILYYHQAATAS